MEESRLIRADRLIAAGAFTNKPCLVYSLCAIAVATAQRVFTVYDGFDTTGKVIMRLVALTYTADVRNFDPPLYFAKGLYVSFTSGECEVFAQFLEIGR